MHFLQFFQNKVDFQLELNLLRGVRLFHPNGRSKVDSHPKLDDIDTEILKTLLINARTSFAKIARKCGVSINTIVNRFNRLKKTGVITGTRLLLKEEQFLASIVINTFPELEHEIFTKLKSSPNTLLCFQQVGKYDIYATVRVESLEEIDQIREELKKTSGVKNIVVSIVVGNPSAFTQFHIANLAIFRNGGF